MKPTPALPDTHDIATPRLNTQGEGPAAALSAPLKSVLRSVGDGHRPTTKKIASAIHDITGSPAGPARDAAMAWLVSGIMAKGPHHEDVIALLQGATQRDGLKETNLEDVDGRPVVAIAGSGKKNLRSFNISTPAALIAATCGANVVKMGSHATSSIAGSRALAAARGIPESVNAADIIGQLHDHSFAFVPIESTMPKLDSVYGRRFHIVTPFSFGLAALACPLRPYATVFGVSHPKIDVAAQVLGASGFSRVYTTASVDEPTGRWADEFAMGSTTFLATMSDGATVRTTRFDSEVFAPAWSEPVSTVNRDRCGLAAEVFTRVIDGEGTDGMMQVVTAGAGLILYAAGIAPTIGQGQQQAQQSLSEGRPRRLLKDLTGVRCA